MSVRLQFLGTPLLLDEQQLDIILLPGKAVGLLAFLAVENQPFTRDKLADLFWSTDSEAQAKHNLRQLLQNIKKFFPHILTLNGRRLIALNAEAIDTIDVWQFEEACQMQQYDQAASLLRGEFLEGLNIRDAENFEQWRRLKNAHFLNIGIEILEKLLQQTAQNELIIQYASRLIALEPWHEQAYRSLMLAQARSMRFNEAILTFQKCQKILQDEFSVTPAQQTVAIYEKVQMARKTRQRALPTASSVFVGRKLELEKIANLLADPHCRCLTLMGLGGVGKTSLAVEASTRCRSLFLHGVCFVPLVTAAAGSQLGFKQILLNSLGLSSEGTLLDDQIVAYLQPREMLLILDNFEQIASQALVVSQIIQQAPGIKVLVTSRRRLDIPEEWLLDVYGLSFPTPADAEFNSRAIRENGFGYLAMNSGEGYDAVHLLFERAQQLGCARLLDPTSPELNQICQKVEGVPLAIELIAPWLRTRSPAEILDMIVANEHALLQIRRNFPARQNSLLSVFEHSWQLLSKEQQLVLQRLVSFSGNFSETAVLAVAETDKAMITSLVGNSMLQAQFDGRYRIHPLLRAFIRSKSEAKGTAAEAKIRHRLYYYQFAQEMLPKLRGATQLEALEICNEEFANLQAAWRKYLAPDPAPELLLFADFLFELCSMRNWFETGIQLMDDAYKQLLNKESLLASRLLAYSGFFHQGIGYFETAVQQANQALAAAQQCKDPRSTIQSLIVLGNVCYDFGQYDTAEKHLQECLAAAHTPQFTKERAYSLYRLGLVISLRAAFPDAGKKKPYKPPGPFITEHYEPTDAIKIAARQSISYFHEAAELYQQVGDLWGSGLTLHAIGYSWYQVKAYDQAIQYFWQSAELLKQVKASIDLAQTLNWYAVTNHRAGYDDVAREHFIKALQISLEIGAKKHLLDCLMKFSLFIWVTEKTHFLPLAIALTVAKHPNTDSRMRNVAEEWVENIADYLTPEAQRDVRAYAQQHSLNSLVQELIWQFAPGNLTEFS